MILLAFALKSLNLASNRLFNMGSPSRHHRIPTPVFGVQKPLFKIESCPHPSRDLTVAFGGWGRSAAKPPEKCEHGKRGRNDIRTHPDCLRRSGYDMSSLPHDARTKNARHESRCQDHAERGIRKVGGKLCGYV
jgi:hypothetical protein